MSENGQTIVREAAITKVVKNEDVYYQAMLARDARFDGKFFVGVRTTGIYCRPICPARPLRRNVEFFPTRHAAEAQGYRPCLRCRPESAPHSMAWIGTSAVVQRALKSLPRLSGEDFNEDDFAKPFGVSARHLRRLFQAEIGKTPKQIWFDNRLALARQLIHDTDLAMPEVAHAAGFHSIRRFNAAFRARFQAPPRRLRRKARQEHSSVRLRLPYRPPFDFAGLLDFYRRHQIGQLERFTAESMRRIFELNGRVGEITIRNDPDAHVLLLHIDFPDPTQIHAIVARVRALFDLDSDPLWIANALEADPALGRLWRRYPGTRLPSGWDPFEVAVSAILGQLVSVERGRALVDDLIARHGRDTLHGAKLFPTPDTLARADLSHLKTTGARKQTLKDFAQAIAQGRLSLESTQDVGEFITQARTIRGLGPWTANYIAMKALRHTDAFPATDLILARALEKHPQEVIERMRPWRAYAAVLLWRAYAKTLSKRSEK